MAGDSARDFARRQRDKAARLQRSAEMWERGALGEATTGAILDGLRPYGWTIFHDVRWPGRQRANIDHVAVGPNGVFVVDSKNWSGDIRVVGDVLLQGTRRREKEVASAADAAIAITQLLQGLPATPVLCFVRPEPIDGWARDVMVCSTQNLIARLTSQPAVLGPESTRRVTAILGHHLAPATTAIRQRAPRRQPAPVSRRPAGVRRILFRLLAAALGLVVVAVGTGFALAVVSSIGRAVQEGAPRTGEPGDRATSAPVLGDALMIPASASHPALRLKADKVERVAMTDIASRILQGYHLVAVRFSLRNGGTQLWGAAPPLQFSAMTSDGQPAQHSRDSTMSPQEILPAAFNLKPGKQRRGFVVFVVPDGARLVRASIQLSYSSADGAQWLIP